MVAHRQIRQMLGTHQHGGTQGRGNVKKKAYGEYGIGYQEGGPVDYDTSPDPGAVNQAIQSISLDEREHNPKHATEDEEPLSTRPPNPPVDPNPYGYKRGGPVRTGYQGGGEVDDEEDTQDEADTQDDEEQQPVDQDDEEDTGAETPDEETGQDGQVGQPSPEGDRNPLKTGYKPVKDQDREREQGATDTGYDRAADNKPRSQDPSNLLREVIDWTRKFFGILGPEAAQAAPAQPATGAATAAPIPAAMTPPGMGGIGSDVARAPAPAEAAAPTTLGGDRPWYAQDNGMLPINAVRAAVAQAGRPAPPTGRLNQPPISPELSPEEQGTNPLLGKLGANLEAFGSAKPPGPGQQFAAPLTQQTPTVPLPTFGGGAATAAPTQASLGPPGTAGGPAAAAGIPGTTPQKPTGDVQTALRDYINGARSFTPDEMTKLLNDTTKINPNLDMNGAIAKTFNDLARTQGMNAASKFLQALKPSYANVHAAATAAMIQGDAQAATRLASQMDNLIPGGVTTNFGVGRDGSITAVVRDQNGQTKGFSLTPQQFAQYLTNPQYSEFDHSATMGMDQIMSQLGATPVAAAGQIGGARGPATGMLGRTTGYATLGAPAPSAPVSPMITRTGMRPEQGYYDEGMGYHKTAPAQPNTTIRYASETPTAEAGGGTAEQRHQLDLQRQAQAAYPGANQGAQRAAYLAKLQSNEAKAGAAAITAQGRLAVEQERNRTRETPEQRAARSAQVALSRIMTTSERSAVAAMDARQKAATTQGIPFQITPAEQKMLDQINKRAADTGVYDQLRQQAGYPPAAAPTAAPAAAAPPPGAVPPAPAPGYKWQQSSKGNWRQVPVQ